MTGDSRAGLAVGIWAFLACKSIGVLWSLAYLAFAVRWVLPRFSQGGPEAHSMQAAYVTEVAFDALEAGLTILGLVLVLQRHRIARWYWIVLLGLYCLARLSEVLLGPEPLMPALFLVTGVAWLLYWMFGREPRALALSLFWIRPGNKDAL